MSSAKRFEDLEVWQRTKDLTNLIYRLSTSGDFSRDFGLRDQMRRASVSVMSNIAEGFESQTQAMFIKYLAYTKSSAGEVRAQLYIAKDQAYINGQDFQEAFSSAEIWRCQNCSPLPRVNTCELSPFVLCLFSC